MGAFSPVELVGYLASALIVLSLVMASALRLRIINLIGATVFAVYGTLIGSWPVIVTNAAIIGINVYYLTIMLRSRARQGYFEVVAVPTDSPILHRFVAQHVSDMRRFQPSFASIEPHHLVWMILHDAAPVGVVVGERDDDHIRLHLDYVIAEHRDFTAGELLFGHSGTLHYLGIDRVSSLAETDAHRRYLEKMGFRRANGHWERAVDAPDEASRSAGEPTEREEGGH